MKSQNLGNSILDAFKKDSQYVQNDKDYNTALQEEINKQLKAIADYDANPELLDSQIKFNPEEFDYNERKISKQLYIEEDHQYPAADDPEELLKTTLSGKTYEDFVEDKETSIPKLEQCECNEVKVGDKIVVYDGTFLMSREIEVTEIVKVYNPFTFDPVVAVMVRWDCTSIHGKTWTENMKLSIPDPRNTYHYFNPETKEEITQLTFKDEN